MPLTGPAPASPPATAYALAGFDLSPFDARMDPAARAPVAVAYSGGGDSLALLLAAKAWAARVGRRVLALHVDHGLQPQSRAWAALAERTARDLGADFRLMRWQGAKPSTGLPAAARAARLRLLAEATRDAGVCVLLLGHTADDVREEAAMRAEGSNLGRLRDWSPSPVWPEGRLIFHFRPLLAVGRADLRRMMAGQGLEWVEDPANDDPHYARARARRRLSAVPPADLGPAVETEPALAQLCGSARFDAAGVISIDRGRLQSASSAAASQFIRMALLCASGTARPPRSGSVESLLARLRSTEPVDAALSGARVVADGTDVLFARNAGDAARGGLRPLLLTPGETAVWDGRFETEAAEPGLTLHPLAGMAARLPKAERETLRAVPAATRPSLPVVVNAAQTLTCPILADGPVRVRPLARSRFLAAAGLAATESQAGALAHGAKGSHVLF